MSLLIKKFRKRARQTIVALLRIPYPRNISQIYRTRIRLGTGIFEETGLPAIFGETRGNGECAGEEGKSNLDEIVPSRRDARTYVGDATRLHRKLTARAMQSVAFRGRSTAGASDGQRISRSGILMESGVNCGSF